VYCCGRITHGPLKRYYPTAVLYTASEHCRPRLETSPPWKSPKLANRNPVWTCSRL